jgi:hypothetical protein
MQATVLRQAGTAPAVSTSADPVVTDDHVLVRVTAAVIAPLDRFIASGASHFGPPHALHPGLSRSRHDARRHASLVRDGGGTGESMAELTSVQGA